MLFRDRLEIINPGTLPKGTTREDLYRPHDSNPRNEIIAQAMSWTSYVEKSGNGTREIVRKCIEHGLAEPVFEPRAGFFHVIISASGSMKRCLLALIEDGLVAPTRPQKRGSRLQTYRITDRGIKFLQQRVKEVDL